MTKRILIVEDSRTQAERLRSVLADAGYEVEVAQNGEAALAALEAGPADAVLTDIVMPGAVDGFELCRRMKAGPLRHVPVLLLTSLADPTDVLRALECGANSFLRKPYDPTYLLERLRVLFATRQLQAEHSVPFAMKVTLMGREVSIDSERQHVLDLLVATFEESVLQNGELRQREGELRIANGALEQRLAQLGAANEELEAFSYSVSHDLRTPLRAIDGYGQMLLEDHEARLDPEGKRLLGVISQEARRMGQLIDDLLGFSRLGRTAVDRSLIDMTAMAHDAFTPQAALHPNRVFDLHVQPLPPAHGDPPMVRVVLDNLLSNAIKYTAGRSPAVITIGSCQQDGQAVYYVKDNGAGFDMRYANKLFGVFQRLHAATEFAGNGVGLALVKRIVGRHGGRVWAEAQVSQGATFYFTLPNDGGPS